MDQKSFLIINGLIIMALLYLFWRSRKKEGPSTLNLEKGPRSSASRVLSVVFNYNGESWDAFEVLGLSAGASVAQAEQAYREMSQKQPTSEAFLMAAFEAIKKAYQA